MLIESLSEKCANQKKSSTVLKKMVAAETQGVNGDISECKAVLEELKKAGGCFDDRSLRENSSFFERKRKSEDYVTDLGRQFEQLCASVKESMGYFKGRRKEWSVLFREKEDKLSEFARYEYKHHIRAILDSTQLQYDTLLCDLTTSLSHNDLTSLPRLSSSI